MRLLKLKVVNFRRFAGEQSIDLNEDLIALVGPNEAGKSSVLDALALLCRSSVPSAADTTRGTDGPSDISGLFLLEPEDRKELSVVHDADRVTHAWVTFSSEGPCIWDLRPSPHRDLRPRKKCLALLKRLEGDSALDEQFSVSEDLTWSPELYGEVMELLESDEEALSPESNASLTDLARRLQAIEYKPESPEGRRVSARVKARVSRQAIARGHAADELDQLVEIEASPSPRRLSVDILSKRMPAAAVFDEAQRELQGEYVIADVFDDIPPALKNLCDLGDLDLTIVHSDLSRGNVAHVEGVFERANALLREQFSVAWTQSGIYPRLTTPLDGVMRIVIATEDEDYSPPAERSDGLRWFMALYAFLASRDARHPILLVDEAETHLHYDAQADLIDVLMRQQLASKVVYTTHSLGCLPPDLGSAIRAILPITGSGKSQIANSYWSVAPDSNEQVGYTPLLFAMGAQLLALTVPRYAIIAEGPSDAILLPTMLREAAELRSLPYRVVPGLSVAGPDELSSLRDHAGAVAFLTDDDESGRDLAHRLKLSSIPAELIFSFGTLLEGCTLEDIVAPITFAEAVNDELTTWNIGPWRVDASEVPRTARWGWLLTRGIETNTATARLSKVRVAQRMVEFSRRSDDGSGRRQPIVDRSYLKKMRLLHQRFCQALDCE